MTPNHSDTFTFVDDCVVSEGIPGGHNLLFKNSSEVWEEFKGAGYDPFGIPVADAGIPASPSSSLLSEVDLVEDTTPPPLPEATAASIRLESRRIAAARHASLFDFPCPPILVPNRKVTFGDSESRSISGSVPMVSRVSHPRQTRFSQPSAEKRWSTLPPAEFHPNELVTTRSTGTLRTGAAKRTVADPPVVAGLPFAATSSFLPGDTDYDLPLPVRRSRRQEEPDVFASFIDMSVNEPTLSKSRVHNFFSKLSDKLNSRNKRH